MFGAERRTAECLAFDDQRMEAAAGFGARRWDGVATGISATLHLRLQTRR